MKRILFGAGLALTLAGPGQAAGIIEAACLKSERTAASSALCNCIQKVADSVLAPHEQRKGAAFFTDPHKSQETRQSRNSGDSEFWEKWKAYGASATKFCS